MRLLIYNIAYGTGSPRSEAGRLLTAARYLKTPRRRLHALTDFAIEHKPDVIGLLEADSGSWRTGGIDQAEYIASKLKLNAYGFCKYDPSSIGRKVPIMRDNINAVIGQPHSFIPRSHYLSNGVKRLILEADFPEFTLYLVHLSLRRHIRKLQLEALTAMLPFEKPLIVAGDFNTFGGCRELEKFCKETKLMNVNVDQAPTCPAWSPRYVLDHILVSPDVKVDEFMISEVKYSDHCPLLLDFHI